MWFQQNGATCHTTQVNMALLQETFAGRVIYRRSDINWPPRPCDLTPLDIFLWGYTKDRVYADKQLPSTLEHLKPTFVKLWLRHRLISVLKSG